MKTKINNLTPFILKKLDHALLTPIKSIKKRYIPLLMIYFAFGASGFSSIALTFWQKDFLALSAEQLISISLWASIPWTLKMIFGQAVDSIPIFGSRRKAYVFLGAIFMILGTIVLAGLAGNYEYVKILGSEYNIYLTAGLLSITGLVIQDVTADTMSTEVVERHKVIKGEKVARPEKEIQSELAMVQVLGRLALSLAGFAVAGLGGYLAKTYEYETVFWLTLLIPLISCIGVLFVKLDKIDPKEIKPLNPLIIGGGILFGIFTFIMATSNFAYAQETIVSVSFVILVLMILLVTKNLERSKLKILLFTMLALFIYRAAPHVGPGMSWWIIDELGFDQVFFGVLAQIGSLTALIILWVFADFITKKPIKYILILLIFAEAIMSLPEIGLYFGVHETLGISAKTVALFDTAIESPLVHISMVPVLTLIAYYAPAGNRGTWFAIGASFMNLATNASFLFTKYLNKIFIITREITNEAGEIITAANYDDLGSLLIITVLIAFLIPLSAVFLLIKNIKKS